MKEYAELIQALASLSWPLVTAGVIFYYRKEIKGLLARIKRGKFLGQELELEEPLKRLTESAEVAAAEVPLLSTVTNSDNIVPSRLLPLPFEVLDPIEEVLSTAKTYPYIAFMLLSDLVDKELREIIYSQGELDHPLLFTPSNVRLIVKKRNLLAPHLLRALRDFQTVRNAIVQAPGQVSDTEVLRALDSGIKILEALQSVPRAVYRIHKASVRVYSDAECKIPRQDVSGVILEMGEPDGPKAYHIYPTTRVDYRDCNQVAWEWSGANQWGPTWYRDPETGEIKSAWSGSLEFVGRPIHST